MELVQMSVADYFKVVWIYEKEGQENTHQTTYRGKFDGSRERRKLKISRK